MGGYITELILLLSVVDFSYSGRTSTWDICHCSWLSWQSWSDCTEICGGGTKRRERLDWHHDVLACEVDGRCATDDMYSQWTSCNTFCKNGGSFVFSNSYYGTCRCQTGNKGRCCEQIVSCGTPSAISHGKVIGHQFTYNKKITYRCDVDYNMTVPSQAQRTCSESGYWTGQLPSCAYAVSCRSNPCENSATCISNLGDYTCVCRHGWTGKNCEIDIQPPMVSGCPSNRTVVVSNLTSYQSWSEPTFTDPHGFNVHVTKNYQDSNFEFPWGIYTIAYDAVKPSNGMAAECRFAVWVKPHTCPALEAPKFGILVCNGWQTDNSNICKYYCLKGYTLPLGFKESHIVTCGASGNWFPVTGLDACIPEELTSIKPTEKSPSFEDCKAASDIRMLAETYLDDLKRSAFNALCTDFKDECITNNVRVLC